MSKIFSKTVKKTTLLSVIIAIVLAAAIVVCALFGFNLTMKDKKVLTVSLNAYVYNTQLDEIKADLVEELNSEYTIEGGMSGDVSEVVFVFDEDADIAALKTKAETYLDTKLANSGAHYNVSASVEEVKEVLAKNYVLRAAIAGAVLAVLAFAYVSIRYNLANGIAAGVSVLLGMLLTASIIVLTRVYVTEAAAIVITLAGLLTAVMTLFTLNNVRAADKEGVSEETVVSSIAVKEVLYTAAVVAVGILAVGILGKTAGIWFAVSALIAVAVSACISLFFAPAAYLSLQTAFDNKPAKGVYVGAKKTSTKEKKAPAAKEVEVAPVEEAPAEEEVEEEAPVEEAPAEEEVEEAPVEETPAEEVEEAPVEEAPAEEVAEENAEN